MEIHQAKLDRQLEGISKMNKAIIYELVSPSGKRYIGSTRTSFTIRLRGHKSDLDRGTHYNHILQAASDKYGFLYANILEEFEYEIIKDISDREQYYMDTLKPEYNLCDKAYAPLMNQATKDKLSIALKGTIYSDERRASMNLEAMAAIARTNGKKGSKVVLVKNIITGEEIEFKSINVAARTLSINTQNICTHLKNPTRWKSRKGFVFKYKDDDTITLNELVERTKKRKIGIRKPYNVKPRIYTTMRYDHK